MWSDKKIILVVDTNIFERNAKKPYDFSKLPLDKFDKILKTISLNNLDDEIKILFPEIVVLELLYHHKRRASDDLKKLNKLNNNFINVSDMEIKELNLDIDQMCANLKIKYFKELNILYIPKDKESLFNQILKMSLDKIPPFEIGKSDKGFKDAILFLSLIDYAKNNNFDKMVLFSDDKIFKNNEKEFLRLYSDEVEYKHSKKLEIVKSKDLISYINNEFELFKDLKNYIGKYFFSILENKYASASQIHIQGYEFEIEEIELYEDDTHIYQLDDNTFEVEFFFDVRYYGYDYDYIVLDDSDDFKSCYVHQSENYIFKRIDNEWEVELSFRNFIITN